MATLAVRTVAQRIVVEEELLGQLSDGHWENTVPARHWVPWCGAEVLVDADSVGRDFRVPRADYRFDRLMDSSVCVERMIRAVQAAGIDYGPGELRRDLADLRGIFQTERR